MPNQHTRKTKYLDDNIDVMVSMYKSGSPLSEIAKHFGTAIAPIHRRIRDLVPMRPAKSPSGSSNYAWKGEGVSYGGLHAWVKRQLEKPEACEFCKTIGYVELANKSQQYKRSLGDWMWLCKSCHFQYDNRDKYLKKNREKLLNKLRNKTHCKHGHEYKLYARVSNNGWRTCRECHRLVEKRRREARRSSWS